MAIATRKVWPGTIKTGSGQPNTAVPEHNLDLMK